MVHSMHCHKRFGTNMLFKHRATPRGGTSYTNEKIDILLEANDKFSSSNQAKHIKKMFLSKKLLRKLMVKLHTVPPKIYGMLF